MTNNTKDNKSKDTIISRKEAIEKMGKYAAITAVGTFTILNPLHSQIVSLPPTETNNPFTDLE